MPPCPPFLLVVQSDENVVLIKYHSICSVDFIFFEIELQPPGKRCDGNGLNFF